MTLTISDVKHSSSWTLSQNLLAQLISNLGIPQESNKSFTNYKILKCSNERCRREYDPEDYKLCPKCTFALKYKAFYPDVYVEFKGLKDVYQADGKIHEKGSRPMRDREQDQYLEKQYGLKIHRFKNWTILNDLEVVQRYMQLRYGLELT